jgi:hypothetical protein
MDCAGRKCLEHIYRRAGANLEACRTHLLDRLNECSLSELLALSDEMSRTRELLDHVHERLQNHIRRHGCVIHIAVAASEGKDRNEDSRHEYCVSAR